MAMTTITDMRKETVEKLQDLIKVNLDSSEGFRAAAERCEDPGLTSLFVEVSKTRGEFARRLQGLVAVNGEEPEDSGSWEAKVHRWWLDLRASVSTDDSHAVLSEAERGEDVIKKMYEDVLTETAGSVVNDVLLEQYSEVKRMHDRVRDLRDKHRKA